MAKSSSQFAGMRAEIAPPAAPVPAPAPVVATAPVFKPGKKQAGREGKSALIGYFSPELCSELKQLAARERVTMQSLMGEAIDLLMHSRGLHKFNER